MSQQQNKKSTTTTVVAARINKAIKHLKDARFELQEAGVSLEDIVNTKLHTDKPIELHELVQMGMSGSLCQLRDQVDDAAKNARRQMKTIIELDLGV